MYDMRADRTYPVLMRTHARALVNKNDKIDLQSVPEADRATLASHLTEEGRLDDQTRQDLLELLSNRKYRQRVQDAVYDVAAQHPCPERDRGRLIGGGAWDWFKANWLTILQVFLALLAFLKQEETESGSPA